jgi:hypothetical protein
VSDNVKDFPSPGSSIVIGSFSVVMEFSHGADNEALSSGLYHWHGEARKAVDFHNPSNLR